MDCDRPAEPLRDRLRRQAAQAGVPLKGMLELTRRCSFRCPVCYVGPAVSAEGELDTADWTRLMEEAAAAGCLELLLTGGEPLLRDDFQALYIQARRLGMEVSVFTNGALVDAETVALFKEYPPRLVEISVYGATEAVARRVTGVAGACAAQWRSIRLLQEGGVNVGLKVLAIRSIRGEIETIEERARQDGLPIRLSVELTPRLDGDTAPMAERLDPEEAVALEAREPGWAETIKARIAGRAHQDCRYPCAAGQYGFFIDAQGWLQPCLALRTFRKDVRNGGLLSAWRAVVEAARGQKRGIDRTGDNQLFYGCFMCMGFMEWGGGRAIREWHLRVAHARLARVE